MKFTFTNLSFIILLLFISGSYSQSIAIYSTIDINNNGNGFIHSNGYFGQNPHQLNITVGPLYDQRAINITYINSNYFEGYAPLGFIGYHDVRIYNTYNGVLLYYGYEMTYYHGFPQPTPTPTSSSQTIDINYFTVYRNNSGYINVNGYFGQNPHQLNITVGPLHNQSAIYIISIDSYYMQGYAPLGYQGYQDVRIYNTSNGDLLSYGSDKAYYYYDPEPTPLPTSTPTPLPTSTPTPQPIEIASNIYVDNNGNGFINGTGYFGQNPYQLNITVGSFYDQRAINITYIGLYSFEGYAPLGYQGYQDVRIYNVTSKELLYTGYEKVYYYSADDSSSTETPSVTIQFFTVPANRYVSSYGYFGINPSVHINISIGNYQWDQQKINITYIDSNYFEGYAPSGYQGYQDVRIYNVTSNQLLYTGYEMAYYYLETPTPSDQPIEITSNIYVDNNGNGFINGTGYFGQNPYQLNITIGDYYYKRAIMITYIDSYYFQGYAPLGYQGYQDVRIYNVYSNELLYTGYGKAIYYYGTGSSSSSPTESPTTTPTASPSTPVIQCKYSSNGFYINSTESIQCYGTGPSYCETNSGSTCSTESNNSTIKCTTGSGSSSFYCIGNNIKCKSSYVTCSIEKPQSSYLLVNGIEQKSNYYDHSQPNNNINNNNQNDSSSASIIYSSLSLLGLLISSILIIV